MKTLTTEQTQTIILTATTLRAQGKFDEAIKTIKDNLPSFDPDLQLNGQLEMFYAAKSKGDVPLARQVAREIAQTDPDIPSIQPFLK